MVKRIISVITTFVILCSFQINAFADDYTNSWESANFWESQLLGLLSTTSDIPVVGGLVQGLGGCLYGGICSLSSDGFHHADTPQRVSDYRKGFGNSVSSATAYCVCKYCGEEFDVVITEDDLSSAYDSQVAELPATGVTSSGNLLVNPFDYPSLTYINPDSIDYISLTSLPISEDGSTFSLVSGTFSYLSGVFISDSPSDYHPYLFCSFSAPVSGLYVLVSQPGVIWKYTNSSGLEVDFNSFSDPSGFNDIPSVSGGSFYSGDTVFSIKYYPGDNNLLQFPSCIYATLQYFPPLYEVSPFDSSVVTNNYTVNSRPTSITGDYGIIGDNGQITKVESTTIVNETNNTFTNPSTGATSTITEWTYDYSDRSYDLTLDTGDTVTVTYGDENITIQEGDTVYNIYYIVNGTGEGTDPDVCQHTYTSTVDREATCTIPGQTTYICSLCGHTYTEAIPAKGHTWTVFQTVTTEYDQEGNLLQQGYTIYQCSVCGEQYKDETGTGPPGSGDSSGEEGETIWDKLGNLIGSIFDGLLGIVEAVIGKVLDALIALVEMISEKLGQVVTLVLGFFDYIPGLFTGFLGFLSAVFPFLPEDIMTLLTFGIAVVVFIGIIKALRR